MLAAPEYHRFFGEEFRDESLLVISRLDFCGVPAFIDYREVDLTVFQVLFRISASHPHEPYRDIRITLSEILDVAIVTFSRFIRVRRFLDDLFLVMFGLYLLTFDDKIIIGTQHSVDFVQKMAACRSQ